MIRAVDQDEARMMPCFLYGKKQQYLKRKKRLPEQKALFHKTLTRAIKGAVIFLTVLNLTDQKSARGFYWHEHDACVHSDRANVYADEQILA